MTFEERLQKAIERGQRRGAEQEDEARAKALSEEELRRMHTQFRLTLSERIEGGVARLANHFPGFRTETLYGDRGWGATCWRDDLAPGPQGRGANFFSRLEMAVRPYSPTVQVLELAAKGTVRNKEIFNRAHFEKLGECDMETFAELIDLWILEYAEIFAASR
jgi:hypothetical protein